MTTSRRLLVLAAGCLLSGGPAGSGAFAMPPDSAANACERAGLEAERASGLPAGVLLAIGRVESGRWDDARRRFAPWPWTINASGQGKWFDTKDAAATTVRTLLESGTRSIDVGCFQISLLWHPGAFPGLEQAFDPDANARYAARFLLSLYSRTGSWEAAIEAYHSADPVLGFAYRQLVEAAWRTASPVMSPVRSEPVTPRAVRPVTMPLVYAGVSVWTPVAPGAGGEVVAMPGVPAAVRASFQAQMLPVVSYHMPKGITPHR